MTSVILKTVNSDKWFRIDQEFVVKILRHKWYLSIRGYVQANINRQTIMLHRFILDYVGSKSVDHINSDKLDCRVSNLRIVSHSDNNAAKKRWVGKSGYPCVFFAKRKFFANVKIRGRRLRIKARETAFQAAVDAQNLLEIHRPAITTNVVWRPW